MSITQLRQGAPATRLPHRVLLLIAITTVPVALAQRPPAIVPSDPGTVLEVLPKGYSGLAESLRDPNAVIDPDERIRRLLVAAARTGDARLVARAEALLPRTPAAGSSIATLRARAFIAQHRHDFGGAAKLLDEIIHRRPRDFQARLARAQINLVRGELTRARSDCISLVLGIDAHAGTLCTAAFSLRTGRHAAAAMLLDRWLEDHSTAPEARRHALVMRAEAAAKARGQQADAWFRQALALSPGDVRTLAAYARYLRDVQRHRHAAALLENTADHDGLQLQYALAVFELDPPRARRLTAALARRYERARAAGAPPELRDEAELLLTLRGKPVPALALAQRNFATQRDAEDVDILLRAASAAGRPDVVREVEHWARTQHLPPPSR